MIEGAPTSVSRAVDADPDRRPPELTIPPYPYTSLEMGEGVRKCLSTFLNQGGRGAAGPGHGGRFSGGGRTGFAPRLAGVAGRAGVHGRRRRRGEAGGAAGGALRPCRIADESAHIAPVPFQARPPVRPLGLPGPSRGVPAPAGHADVAWVAGSAGAAPGGARVGAVRPCRVMRPGALSTAPRACPSGPGGGMPGPAADVRKRGADARDGSPGPWVSGRFRAP